MCASTYVRMRVRVYVGVLYVPLLLKSSRLYVVKLKQGSNEQRAFVTAIVFVTSEKLHAHSLFTQPRLVFPDQTLRVYSTTQILLPNAHKQLD